MDHPQLIVSNQKEESISIQRLKAGANLKLNLLVLRQVAVDKKAYTF